MTQQETIKVMALIQEVYPRFMDGRNPNSTIALWGRMFEGEPYQIVETALMAFIAHDTKGFAPSIGQIKESIAQMREGEQMSEIEAWGLVRRALRNGIYGYHEEYAKLPEDIRATLGDAKILHEWAMMDPDTVESVIASNFQRSYRRKRSAIRETMKLPPTIRDFMGYIAKPMNGEAGALPAEIMQKLEALNG